MSASCDVPVAKVCGLCDASAARVAIANGAWALGFILAPSRRQVTPEQIATIRTELPENNGVLPPMVGVTVNALASDIADAVAAAGLDMVQLSGDESPEILRDIDIPVIKALRFESGTSTGDARRAVDKWLSGSESVDYVIVEGHAAGSYGGTGTAADWELAAHLAEEFPIILAGGLTPENVGPAIQQVRPWGVDVSSGVETEGVKDPARIVAFLSNVNLQGSPEGPAKEMAAMPEGE